jgi:hypothetical protein
MDSWVLTNSAYGCGDYDLHGQRSTGLAKGAVRSGKTPTGHHDVICHHLTNLRRNGFSPRQGIGRDHGINLCSYHLVSVIEASSC